MNIKDLKEGQTIYALPTGNNVCRYDESRNKIFPVVIKGLKRKYIHVQFPNGQVHELNIDNGATKSAVRSGLGCNAGYKFYLSEEDYIKSKLLGEMVLEFRGLFWPQWLTDDIKDQMLVAYINHTKGE